MLDALDKFALSPEVTRPEAARRLIKLGLSLHLPAINLLDAIEIAGLLEDPRLKAEINALKTAIPAHHEISGDD